MVGWWETGGRGGGGRVVDDRDRGIFFCRKRILAKLNKTRHISLDDKATERRDCV